MLSNQLAAKIETKDNVIVALTSLKSGQLIELENEKVELKDDIPFGHKISLVKMEPGDSVIKYGHVIGKASKTISPGEWVHTHNVKTTLDGTLDYEYNPLKLDFKEADGEIPTFRGYERDDGRVGVRNEIWILSNVSCINTAVNELAREARKKYRKEIGKRIIDGIHPLTQSYGCGQMGEDHERTQRLLAQLVKHPNAAAVLVVGLGCENNQFDDFQKVIGDYDPERIRFLTLQEVEDDVEAGLEEVDKLINYAAKFKRKPLPISKLKIGLKCGGSDSFSGITANPLLGRFSDSITAYGGSVILTEVPEMFGAETILMNRAVDKKVFQDIVELINGFKDYYLSHGQVVYENPSPGNKEGGITTLEDKSLGNIRKGGSGPVQGVSQYAEEVTKKGLNLLEGPGYDIVATTALVAAGAQILLFTTGRGNPLGSPVPTVKVASNTVMASRKKNWIDFNAGVLLEERATDEIDREFFDLIVRVASGEEITMNEINDCREIGIFKTGVIL